MADIKDKWREHLWLGHAMRLGKEDLGLGLECRGQTEQRYIEVNPGAGDEDGHLQKWNIVCPI